MKIIQRTFALKNSPPSIKKQMLSSKADAKVIPFILSAKCFVKKLI